MGKMVSHELQRAVSCVKRGRGDRCATRVASATTAHSAAARHVSWLQTAQLLGSFSAPPSRQKRQPAACCSSHAKRAHRSSPARSVQRRTPARRPAPQSVRVPCDKLDEGAANQAKTSICALGKWWSFCRRAEFCLPPATGAAPLAERHDGVVHTALGGEDGRVPLRR